MTNMRKHISMAMTNNPGTVSEAMLQQSPTITTEQEGGQTPGISFGHCSSFCGEVSLGLA